MNKIQNKVVFICGGTGGIGADIIRLLVWEGAKVIIGSENNGQARELAAELGSRVKFMNFDIADTHKNRLFIKEIEYEFGHIDIIINNMQEFGFGIFGDYSVQHFREVIDINLITNLNSVKALSKLMLPAGGAVINLLPEMSSLLQYTVRGLIKGLEQEIGKRNIHVNSISYEYQGGTISDYSDDGIKRFFTNGKDISDIILFLAGDGSSFISGCEFVPDSTKVNSDEQINKIEIADVI